MLEACTALLTRRFNIKRSTAIAVTILGCTLVGLASTLSFGAWSDVKLFNKTIFDLLDYVTSNVGMPLSTFGIANCRGLGCLACYAQRTLASHPMLQARLNFIRIIIGVVSPLFVLVRGGWQPLMQDPHQHGRQLVFTVLLTEYRAHKSLWLGGLAFVVVAALCAPTVS